MVLLFATEAQVAHKSEDVDHSNNDCERKHSSGKSLLLFKLRDLIVIHLHVGVDTGRILRPRDN